MRTGLLLHLELSTQMPVETYGAAFPGRPPAAPTLLEKPGPPFRASSFIGIRQPQWLICEAAVEVLRRLSCVRSKDVAGSPGLGNDTHRAEGRNDLAVDENHPGPGPGACPAISRQLVERQPLGKSAFLLLGNGTTLD